VIFQAAFDPAPHAKTTKSCRFIEPTGFFAFVRCGFSFSGFLPPAVAAVSAAAAAAAAVIIALLFLGASAVRASHRIIFKTLLFVESLLILCENKLCSAISAL
jgi:hypothetical protein